MATPAHDLPLGWWANNLEELDREIARLAMFCKIRILETGAIERVLRNDASVCGSDNAVAFGKLRALLMMHFSIREKSVALFGQSSTAMLEDYVLGRLKERFPQLAE